MTTSRRLQRVVRPRQIRGESGIAISYWELIAGNETTQNQRFDRIAATGCTWLRTDAYWYHLEETQGATNYWAEFDAMLAKAHARNFKIILVIHTTPPWSRPVGATDIYGPTSGAEQDNYATFCARLVQRYGTTISAYEIWNEPNLDQFWAPTPSAASYTTLLQKSYTAMKAVNSAVTIITGGTGGAVPDGKDIDTETFIAAMYTAGCKNYCDGLAVHPYTNKDGIIGGELWLAHNRIRSIMDTHGDTTKLLWGTETGAPTKGTDGVRMTEWAHEQLVPMTYTYWRQIHHAGPLIWYTIEDRSHTAVDVESYFGMVRRDGQKKLSYRAMMTLNGRAGAQLPRIASYPTRVVSVRDYGALVDGTTDDTEALNTAITAVATTGGIVTIPDATLRVVLSTRNWISIPSNVTLRGLGARSTITVETPNTNYHELFRLTGSNICIEALTLRRVGVVYGAMLNVNDATNVWLNRLEIDGQKTIDTAPAFHGIFLSGSASGVSDGINLIGMTMRRCDFGLLHTSADTATFRNITVDSCLFEDNRATDLEFNAPNSVMQYITVRNSTFRNNAANGPSAGWSIGLANVQHCTIADNSITNYIMNGIHIEDRSADVSITGTTFVAASTRNTGYASHVFIISGSHDITVTSNTFDTRSQTNTIWCVYIGAGGAGRTEPSTISATGNTAYLANSSTFAYVEGGTTNITTSPNTIA